jgi:hypothetical protein
MGVFDYLRCHFPLDLPGANELEYQTKDTPAQYLDHYEITKDGILRHEDYDVEDRSEPGETGIKSIHGMMTPINKRWVEEREFTGEIEFGSSWISGEWGSYNNAGSILFRAYFQRGELRRIEVLENIPPRRNGI